MNFNNFIIGFIFIIFNTVWIWVAMKENGHFSKQEAGQLLLGNLTIYMGLINGDELKFGIAIGSFLASIGLTMIKK